MKNVVYVPGFLKKFIYNNSLGTLDNNNIIELRLIFLGVIKV